MEDKADTMDTERNPGMTRLRMAAWASAVLFLLTILVAMQVTEEVSWTAGDFIFAGVLLFGSLGAYEVVARTTGSGARRAGFGVAIGSALALTWGNAAVGLTDSAADAAFLLLVVGGVLSAFLARFRSAGMARILLGVSVLQVLIGVVALATGIVPPHNSVPEILGLTGFFAALFLLAAGLFHQAARQQTL